MPIKIDKHARQRRESSDGTRILITRWWPRGVEESSIDQWMKDLAPSAKLLIEYRNTATEPDLLRPMPMTPAERWEWFTERYEEEMEKLKCQQAIKNLQEQQESGEVITLLCACHQIENCHRSILARLILGNGILRPSKEVKKVIANGTHNS